nr:tyrosine-type recombinase/integrase [Clostridium paraputrificum]
MSLKEDLFKLVVNNFGSNLSQYEYNQYVIKLRDYLLPYIEKNKSHCDNIEQLFKYEFTRQDIINSTIYYVENNENVICKSAIDDFLISLNRLFGETINEKYFNQILFNIQPFNCLSKDIESEIEKRGFKLLKDRESYPAISNKEYDLLIEYLRNMKCTKISSYQYKIITSLLLLYGFSFDRIININYNDYSMERGILKINCETENRFIELELPYNLKMLMKEFLDIRKNVNNQSNSMFITRTGNKISHGYLTDFFLKVKKEQNIEVGNNRNSFTPTGLAKYSVIKMIMEGMNQSIILDLTGFKLDLYLDCQNEVNNLKNLNLNRYVNKMIRGISIYDDINSF